MVGICLNDATGIPACRYRRSSQRYRYAVPSPLLFIAAVVPLQMTAAATLILFMTLPLPYLAVGYSSGHHVDDHTAFCRYSLRTDTAAATDNRAACDVNIPGRRH